MSENNQDPVFSIQRVYLKDASFEAPHTPQIFLKEWTPELEIDLNVSHHNIEGSVFEIVLKVQVNVSIKKETAFIVEVQQAGIFTLDNLSDEQKEHALNIMCPEIIFPFARETISDAVVRGGFPQLLLSPVSFEALYAEKKAAQGKEATSTKHEHTH